MSSFAGGGGGSGYVITGAISPLYYAAGNIGLHFTGPLVNFGGATGLGVSCATTAFDGTTRIATQAQAYYATPYSVAFGCPFVPSITNLLVRRESGSQALVSISTGAAPGARGTKAIDFQSTRGFAVQVASGSGATCFGSYSKASGSRGSSIGCYNNNAGLKSQAFGYQNQIATVGAVNFANAFGYGNTIAGASDGCNCFGTSNSANYLNCSAFGRSNTVGTRTGAIAFGHSNTCRGATGSAFGQGNAVGSVAYTATQSSAFGCNNTIASTANADKSFAGGYGNTLNSAKGVAVGYSNSVNKPYSVAFGYGNSIGPGAFTATRSIAIGKSNIIANAANSDKSCAVGYNNIINGNYCQAFGYKNSCTATYAYAFGSTNTASNSGAVAFGLACQAIANTATAFGNRCQASGNNSVSFGYASQASSALSVSMGYKCFSQSGTGNVAIGNTATARIANTTVLQPPIIAPKTNGIAQALAFSQLSGVQNVFWTIEIDFTAAGATYTFTLPAGARFFFDEVGVIVEELDGSVTTQPTYSFGITGTNAKYLAAIIGTNLNVLLQRDSYRNLLADVGESSMTFTITVPGVKNTATVYKGKAYIKGLLIELEP